MKEILYYLKDANDKFVEYDNYSESIVVCDFKGCTTNFYTLFGAKDAIFNYEQYYNEGEISTCTVKFPLKVVKITINYTEEEVE